MSKKSKIKVFHLITHSFWGGAQKICYEIVKNLDKEKFKVEVGAKGGGELEKKLQKEKIKFFNFDFLERDFSLIKDIQAFFSLYFFFKKRKYDVLHCHSTKAGILGRLAGKLAGIKKIYFTAHGWGFYNKEEYGWAKKILVFLEKISARASSKIICVSEKIKEDALKEKIADEKKFLVIKNGVDAPKKNFREVVREELKIKKNEIVFGFVGRLSYPKDPLMFIKAAKKVSKNFDNLKFLIIGDGPLRKKCEDFLKKEKLKNVFLLGEKKPEETQKYMFSFDIFCLTSKFEGLPLTIIEAMHCGIPALGTKVGGMPELIKDGENGFLVTSFEELVDKMTLLIKNPSLREKLGKNAKKLAQKYFSLERMIKDYERLYLGKD